MPVNFHYVPPSGPLSGKSFEEQTGQAFNEFGDRIDVFSDLAEQALETSQNAEKIAQQANETAAGADAASQKAGQTAQQALEASKNAQNTATAATLRADAAYDLAAQADGKSDRALAESANAVAQSAQARTESEEALSNSQTAAYNALRAVDIAVQAGGVYSLVPYAVNANNKWDIPERLYAAAPGENFPPLLSAPLYLDVQVNDFKTNATQTCWESSGENGVWIRMGETAFSLNPGLDAFAVAALPAGGEPITGTLSVTATDAGMSASATPGSFSAELTAGLMLRGLLLIAAPEFSNGTLSIGGVEILRVENGNYTLINSSFASNLSSCRILSSGVGSDGIALMLDISWLDVAGVDTQWSEWRQMDNTSGLGIARGTIDLLPFRAAELPLGWHFCNGDRYALASEQGQALNNLSDSFKTDWGIVVSEDDISLPSLFYTDGRGFFLRPADGTARTVGSVEEDDIKSHSHGGILSVGTMYGSGWVSTNGYVWQTGGVAAHGGEETRPLNIGMTPAIYLGV